MTSMMLVNFLSYLEGAICVAVLAFIVVRRQWREYWALGSYLSVRLACGVGLGFLLFKARGSQLGMHTAYKVYFYVYWGSFAVESILVLSMVYHILRNTLKPLKGLQRLGMLLFSVVAGLSVAVALGSAFAPHMTSTKSLVTAISQLQRTQSILTLCLLFFVCVAVRPLGLSYRGRVFGVSLGLGLLAITDLVLSVWLAGKPQMHSLYDVVNGLVLCATLAIWATYFAMREPGRREIALPANSTFLRLNKMGLAWSSKGT